MVDYNEAWDTAYKHWSKGRAGQYLYYMKDEGGNTQQSAVYNYVKYLDKETRAGNISPGRSAGSISAKEEYNNINNINNASNINKNTLPTTQSGGLYYSIDDPNKTAMIRRGDTFEKVTQPISYTRSGMVERSNVPRRIGDNITPTTGSVSVYNQEAGVMSVTEREAQNLQGVPYWKIGQSTTPSQAIEQGAYSSQARPIYRSINTKELYEYNTAQIKYQQLSYNNPQASITDLRKQAVSDTQADFNNLPTSTKARLYGQGFLQGGSSMLYGSAVSFAEASSVQLIDSETGKAKRGEPKGSFGRSIYEVTNYPKGFSMLSSPAFYGKATFVASTLGAGGIGAYNNIKTFGVKGGIMETLSGASLLRIKSGVYTAPPQKNIPLKDVKVYDLGANKQGSNIKVFSYSKGGYGFEGVQVGKGGNIAGYKTTNTPVWEIRAGGLFSKTGTATTNQIYTGSLSGSGSGSVVRSTKTGGFEISKTLGSGLKGGAGGVRFSGGTTKYNVPGSKFLNNYVDKSGLNKAYVGSVSSAGKNVGAGKTMFSSGATQRVYGGKNDLTRTSTVRYKPKVYGTEYNINKMFKESSAFTSKSTGSTVGGSNGQVVKTSIKQGGFGGAFQTPATAQNFKPKPILPIAQQGASQTFKPQQSRFYGTGQYERTIGGNTAQTTQIQKQVPKITQIPAVETIVGTRSRSGRGIRQPQIPIPKINQIQNIAQQPAIKQATASETIQKPRQIPVQKVRQALPTYPKTGSSPFGLTNYPTPTIPTKLPTLPMGGGMQAGYGKIPAIKSPTGYTPSLGAMLFKIKGSKPTARSTGFNLRPIIRRRRKKKK